ncbi:flagellar protein FlgN [Aeoliella sp. ICT_H6.2]|uniref:Flagellar protein FlgN n=1 Tax=Aeoliella straminimaris TaxID=2954799 RepID=A0A9X2F7H2_9BACT|nr:flagellar export chaperone FlgN [Aeoliella straminimaris]MCO6043772.1 flagellar protein FlgN [Aeoliella straminimaris]
MTDQATTQPAATPTTDWEARISQLLSNLSSVQGDLLALLGEKRESLAAGEYEKLDSFTNREAELVSRLEHCHTEREQLLGEARREGLPAGSVRSLAQALPATERSDLQTSVDQARKQSRLLQHHSLTNWVVVQRTLLHLSQMIEIIATGGRMKATYGTSAHANSSGALVDQEA